MSSNFNPTKKPWFKFWPRDVPKALKYPEVPLFHLLDVSAERRSNKTAITFYGAKLTYDELKGLTDKLATALQNIGVEKGDRVAIFLPNCPQYIVSYFGILKTGATVVLLNPSWRESEIEYQLNNSETKFIISLDMIHNKIYNIRKNVSIEREILTNLLDLSPLSHRFFGRIKGVKPKAFPDTLKFRKLVMEHKPRPPEVKIDPKEDIGVLLYSSGITGTPKGVMLTHFNLVANAMQCAHFVYLTVDDVVLAVVPFFHCYGMTTCMNTPIYQGASILPLPRFDVLEVIRTIEKYRPTYFVGVPAMFDALMSYPSIENYNLKSIKYCISGAAPQPTKVAKKLGEVANALVVEGYGLAEASPVTHINPMDDPRKVRFGSIGIPVSDTEAKIIDIDTGMKELPRGEIGEIVIRGPQVMRGYWKMPEEDEVVLRDGWLYTGDIGYMDKDGYFYIVERKKDIMHVHDWNILPREIEAVLHEHPAVRTAAVVGVPDPDYGEIPKAFVVLRKEYEGKVTEEDVLKFCEDNLPQYKFPKYVEFRDELPLTIIGKVFKKELKMGEKLQKS